MALTPPSAKDAANTDSTRNTSRWHTPCRKGARQMAAAPKKPNSPTPARKSAAPDKMVSEAPAMTLPTSGTALLRLWAVFTAAASALPVTSPVKDR